MKIVADKVCNEPPESVLMQVGLLPAFGTVITIGIKTAIRAYYGFLRMGHGSNIKRKLIFLFYRYPVNVFVLILYITDEERSIQFLTGDALA